MKNKVNFKYLNILIILGIAYLLFLMRGIWLGAFEKVLTILLPFIIAFSVAYALYPILKFMMNKKIPKAIGVIIIVVAIVSVIGLTVYFVVPLFINQLINLLSNLSKISTDLLANFNINTKVINSTINTYSAKILDTLSDAISSGSVITTVSSASGFVAKFVIISIVSIYFLADMPNIRLRIKRLLLTTNKKALHLVTNIDTEITSYLKGLGLFMIIQFFEYTFLFFIIGHPNFLLLGLLACLTTVIPYFGGLITNVTALLIASVISPKLFILTLIITIVFPNIDGYVISPKIYGKTNQLPAILTIFSVFAGGALFGFIGIVIAVPVTIIIMAIVKSYRKELGEKIKQVKGMI